VLASPTSGNQVRCELCPFRCVLDSGQTGRCQVRRNSNGVLETATFTASVAHVDAVERKPFYHLYPGAKVLTVASPGCTFACKYCINYRLSQFGREESAPWFGLAADPTTLADRARAAGAMLGLSYSEPGLAPELTLALADQDLPVVWKTNGFLTAAAIDRIAPALTGVSIDIKAENNRDHSALTGAPLRPVLDAVERFADKGVWVEVCTPLIPGTSASPAQLESIAGRIAAISPDLPWHLIRFTPDFMMRRMAPTSPAALASARDIGYQAGLRYVYVERALGAAGRRTDCPQCQATLVERGIWETSAVHITSGMCPSCGISVPGKWG
jgi:pyruvate formate lyase activating enzyme